MLSLFWPLLKTSTCSIWSSNGWYLSCGIKIRLWKLIGPTVKHVYCRSGEIVLRVFVTIWKFSNHFSDPLNLLELAQFVECKSGNHLLLDKMRHTYELNRWNKDSTKCYWICQHRQHSKNNKCNARAVTRGIHVLQWIGEHNHRVFQEVVKVLLTQWICWTYLSYKIILKKIFCKWS